MANLAKIEKEKKDRNIITCCSFPILITHIDAVCLTLALKYLSCAVNHGIAVWIVLIAGYWFYLDKN